MAKAGSRRPAGAGGDGAAQALPLTPTGCYHNGGHLRRRQGSVTYWRAADTLPPGMRRPPCLAEARKNAARCVFVTPRSESGKRGSQGGCQQARPDRPQPAPSLPQIGNDFRSGLPDLGKASRAIHSYRLERVQVPTIPTLLAGCQMELVWSDLSEALVSGSGVGSHPACKKYR